MCQAINTRILFLLLLFLSGGVSVLFCMKYLLWVRLFLPLKYGLNFRDNNQVGNIMISHYAGVGEIL